MVSIYHFWVYNSFIFGVTETYVRWSFGRVRLGRCYTQLIISIIDKNVLHFFGEMWFAEVRTQKNGCYARAAVFYYFRFIFSGNILHRWHTTIKS